MTSQAIIEQLPYSKPFLFVDELTSISAERIEGKYTFKKDEYFYKGHFKGNPITPGIILTECMAQIGLVCLGIYIFNQQETQEKPAFALSSTQVDYYLAVLPGETVTVVSEKVYFRFHKLKCNVKMLNPHGKIICKGVISGMVVDKRKGKALI